MRFRHPDGSVVHLSYGSNVHPAETVDGIVEQLHRFSGGVRSALGSDLLGVGLWLPAAPAAELARDPAALDRVRRVLRQERLEVVTVNAFPYRGFHDPVVKKAVYHPDWTEAARLDFTLDCAWVLARLLPDEAARGSISTLPLGWRSPWNAERDRVARDNLDRLAEGLAKVTAETGRTVRVGLEPEPGCAVETVDDAVQRLTGLDQAYVGICVDTCHLATAFEDGPDALARLTEAGLGAVKAQASAALHAEDPADPATRAALASYAEDRFLHQTREQTAGGVAGRDDLDEALTGHSPLPGRRPWRVHFHVPLHAHPEPPLSSTRTHLETSLAGLVGGDYPVTDHIEIETYTWSVLPPTLRPEDDAGLVAGIAAEVSWVRDRFLGLGLEALEGAPA